MPIPCLQILRQAQANQNLCGMALENGRNGNLAERIVRVVMPQLDDGAREDAARVYLLLAKFLRRALH
ncbi:hypothetical protein D7044_28965 [Micromonospora musae]|uniref:Uncharacterized protein n=1 Tax=Micromonospora musae TaxID=1894970 RepID=A0A3A9Y6G1_9ACTN|nr:hypothetical protein D7044_28965 [Micromonospora musae]